MKNEKGLILMSSEKYPNDTAYFNYEKAEVDNRRSVILKENETKRISSFIEDDVYGLKFSYIAPGRGVLTRNFTYAEAQELLVLLQMIDDSGPILEIMSHDD